jgi:hypothetical protein
LIVVVDGFEHPHHGRSEDRTQQLFAHTGVWPFVWRGLSHNHEEKPLLYRPDPVRAARSLRTCHLPAEAKPVIAWHPDNGRYTPELAAAIDDDPNLCDGARRCARKLAEYTYRRNRASRECRITVSYLARSLRRCRRSVQRYLRQLERAGYIRVHVVAGLNSRMSLGLAAQLLTPVFARHHAQQWPGRAAVAGATAVSHNQSSRYKTVRISRVVWAWTCCEGIWRSYMKTLPAFAPYPI